MASSSAEGPDAFDAAWLATSAGEATLAFALMVQAYVEDVEAASDAGDASTAVECARLALYELARCRALLDRRCAPGDLWVLPLLARRDPEVAQALDTLPPALVATEDDVVGVLATLGRLTEAFIAVLPVAPPNLRDPGGLFPTLRIAREYAVVRAALGLEPYEWLT